MTTSSRHKIEIAPLREEDLEEADRIFRLAFGSFLGFSPPEKFAAGVQYVKTRWNNPAVRHLGARHGERLVGSNFVTLWGSFGFFGPLSVLPELWDQGVGRRLLEATMELMEGLSQAGLFTFPFSPKHVCLYQRFGFFPQDLIPLLTRTVPPVDAPLEGSTRFSRLSQHQQEEALRECRRLANQVWEGLDLRGEVEAIQRGGYGETLLLWEEEGLAGFALCHAGEETEAGPQRCYVKFALVPPGPKARSRFDRLLDLCFQYAAGQGLSQLTAGVNTARSQSYSCLLERGFQIEHLGLCMQKPNRKGYNRPEVFVLDDWR